MRQRAVWLLLSAGLMLPLGLLLPATSAGAQTVSRCYPPPCASTSGAITAMTVPASDPPPVVGLLPSAPADRSAAPFVAAGLVAVTGSLTIVALRRRQQIGRRDGRSGGRVVVTLRTSGQAALSEPQAALR